MADITVEVTKLEMLDRHAARSLFGGVHQLYMNVHVVKHTYKVGLFYASVTCIPVLAHLHIIMMSALQAALGLNAPPPFPFQDRISCT